MTRFSRVRRIALRVWRIALRPRRVANRPRVTNPQAPAVDLNKLPVRRGSKQRGAQSLCAARPRSCAFARSGDIVDSGGVITQVIQPDDSNNFINEMQAAVEQTAWPQPGVRRTRAGTVVCRMMRARIVLANWRSLSE
jgi:hypothetical protein